ncbi:MAG: TIGR00269 family protein [Halobacteriota archaeon]|nr:TIGR00269 family protein [Halobacteriota archaeon]
MTEKIKCFKCNGNAIIFQRYSGMHLCKNHFIDDVERKIKKSIRKNFPVGKGEGIAVALSGGKDSAVTLYILSKIFQERRDIKISAITVDEGIKGYRDNTIKKAISFTRELDVRHHIVSFKDAYGITLDEIVAMDPDQAPCTFCGVLRRQILNSAARKTGVDRVATGHNLDDESQSIFMNYLRGDTERLLRTSIDKACFIPRMKPLQDIPEREVALYAIVNGIDMDMSECPYASQALRNEIREMLNDYEIKHPGTKYSIIRGFDKLSLSAKREGHHLSGCVICEEPCSGVMCKACNLLKQLGKI